MIDSLKDQYAEPIKMAKEEKIDKEENSNNNKVEKIDIKPDMNEDDKNRENLNRPHDENQPDHTQNGEIGRADV